MELSLPNLIFRLSWSPKNPIAIAPELCLIIHIPMNLFGRGRLVVGFCIFMKLSMPTGSIGRRMARALGGPYN